MFSSSTAASNSSIGGFGCPPLFGTQKNYAFSSGFGPSSSNSVNGHHATQLAFSCDNAQGRGSRIAVYAKTAAEDASSAEKLLSISAMPPYKAKSHEELRWEDYNLTGKGGLGVSSAVKSTSQGTASTSSTPVIPNIFGPTFPSLATETASWNYTGPTSNTFTSKPLQFSPSATSYFPTVSSAKSFSPFTTSTPSNSFSPLTTSTPSNSFSPFTTSTPSNSFSPFTTSTPSNSFSPFTTSTPSNSFSPFTTSTPSNSFSPFTTSTPSNSFSPFTTSTPSNSFSPFTTSTPSNSFSPFTTSTPSNSFSPFATLAPSNSFSPFATLAPSNPFSPFTTSAPSNPFSPFTTSASSNPFSPFTTSTSSNPFSPFTTSAPSNPFSPFTTSAPSNPFSLFTTSAPSNPFRPFTTSAPSNPFIPFTTSAPSNPFSPFTTSAPSNPFSPFTTSAPSNPFSPFTTSAPSNTFSPFTTSTPSNSFSPFTTGPLNNNLFTNTSTSPAAHTSSSYNTFSPSATTYLTTVTSAPLNSFNPFTPRTNLNFPASTTSSVTLAPLYQNTASEMSSSQVTSMEKPSSVTSPFGILPPSPRVFFDGYQSKQPIQYGISSITVKGKLAPVKYSLLTTRHLSGRNKLPVQKYDPKLNAQKIPYFSDTKEITVALYVPRENPRALVIGPEKWPPTATRENIHGTYENEIDDTTPEEPLFSTVLDVPARLQQPDYYTQPQISELEAKEKAEPGYCMHIKDFVVGRHGYGSIKFLGETDMRNVDIETDIRFNNREVIVYMDNSKKPPVGEGLNKPAEITLLNIKWFDKKTGMQHTDGSKVIKYTEMLKKKAVAQGAEFVSYDPVEGEWKFRVQHF